MSALVLYVGSFIVNYQNEEAPTIQDEILSYFVEQLAYSRAFTWGSRLIQINIHQLERSHLLQVATSNLIQLQNTTESEFDALLKQIQWKDIGMISSSKSVLKEILIPLKQIIEYSASKNYLKLLYLIGNILLLCSYEFPDVSFEFISSITSGKWPMKLVCSGILQFIPLFALKKENLLTIFGNLYNLHNLPPLDYAKLPESQRVRHREDFIRYILNFPLPNELLQISGNENQQEAQYQPVLFIFYQLAGYSTTGSLFQRLIIQELFFISFSIQAYQIANEFIQQKIAGLDEEQARNVTARNQSLFARFQQEAKDNLKVILIQNPELISTFIFSIGQNLGTIYLDSLLQFLSADIFSNCSIDFYSAKWIGYLFNQRPFSSIELKDLVGNNQGIESLLSSFLHPAPVETEVNPATAEHGRHIGNCLLNLVNWKKAHPVVKMYCALVILESSVGYSGSSLLLGSLGKQLLAPPYDELFLQHILNINFENYQRIETFEGILLQLLIALGIVSEQYRNIKLNQPQQNRSNLIEHIIKMTPAHTQSSIGHRWLLSWGFYTKLQFLLANYTGKDTIALLTKILTWLDVLKEEPTDSFPYIRSLIANFVAIRGINFKDISVIVQQSFIEIFLIHKQPAKPSHPLNDQDPNAQKKEIKAFSKEEMDEMNKRIYFWLSIVYPASRQEKINCLLLNDFISYLYCTGLPLETVVKTIESRNYTKDDISNFASDGYHWFVLLILFSFKPIIPVNVRDRNNGFTFLYTIAQQQSRNPVAIAYWLHFFRIFFEIPACSEYAPKAVQDNLNKHFISVAKFFEDKNRVIYRLYYAFSSWKKAIIDSATGDFHEEQNIELLESVYSLLPEHFHTPAFTLLSSIHSPENENRAREIKFVPSASEETIEIVETLLPNPVAFPKQILPDDMDTYTNVEQAISSSINILTQLFQSIQQQRPAGSTLTLQTKNLPGLSQLTALLSNYRDKCNQLGMLDQDFLEFTKQTHYNYQTPFQIQLPCVKGTSCIRPAIIQINGIKIDQAKPNAITDLQANRKVFNTEYLSFFNVASTIAQTVSIIKFSILSLFNQLLHSSANSVQQPQIVNHDLLSIGSPSPSPAQHSPVSAAISTSTLEFVNSIFFLLLEFILNEKETNLVAVNSHFIELMIQMGNKTIKNQKEYQVQLFNKLLATPSSHLCIPKVKAKKYPKIEEVPIMKSSLLIPPPPPGPSDFSENNDRQNNKGKDEEKEEEYFYPIDLYDLFTPECFLDQSRGTNNEYLNLLLQLMNSNKSEEELNKITSRFNIEILYDLLDPSLSNSGNSSEQELDKIFSLIPLFLSKKSFSKLGSQLMEKLLVSNHQKRVFNLLFSEMTPVEYSERFLMNFNIEKLESSQSTAELLQNFTVILPGIPTKHLSTAIHWLKIITVYSVSFRTQFIQENPSAYDSTGKPIASNLWNLLFHIFSAQGIFTFNDHQRDFNDQQLTSLLTLLFELIELLPNQLIDKLWYLLSGSIFPFLLDHLNYLKSNGESFSSSLENVLGRFSDFPWENTRILLYDPNALKVLNNYLFSLEILISPIFGKLNWNVFLKKLISSNQAPLINEFSVLFFKLFIQINQINPTAIPESLRDEIIPQMPAQSNQPQIPSNPNLLIDWRRIDPQQFKLILRASPEEDGIFVSTLKNTKKAIHAEQLQDNVEYLKNISIYSNQPLIGMFSLFEISSILFTNIKNEHLGQTFCLGNKQQTSLIVSAVVPMIQHFSLILSPFHGGPSPQSPLQSKSPSNDAMKTINEMIQCLFALSEKAKHFQPSAYNGGEGSKKAFHSQLDENQTSEQLQQSVKGIIYQFCAACSPFTALQIIQIPPASPQNQRAGLLPPNIWIQNIESTLRTFFSSDIPAELASKKPLDVTSSFINLSGYDKRELIALAKQESAAFTLLTILHQWRMEVDRMHETAQWPSDIFDCALHFKPNQYRLFDLLPLWFFILELVESRRFHPVQCQQDVRIPICFSLFPPSNLIVYLKLLFRNSHGNSLITSRNCFQQSSIQRCC